MDENTRNKKSRREFFNQALRYAATGLLAVLGGVIYAKRRKLIRQGICINDNLCAECELFNECELSAKQFTGSK